MTISNIETIRKQQQLKEVRPVTIIKPIYPPHNVQGVDRYLRALGNHQLDWLVTRAMDIAEARINERLAERIRQVRAFSNKHFKFFFSPGGNFALPWP